MPTRSVVVVDGYNVLHQVAAYTEKVERDLDSARASLIADVAAWAGPDRRTTVVFDGASNSASDGAVHEVLGVSVIFSPYGHEADAVVEDVVRRAALEGADVLVITSDAQTQWVALGAGAHRMSAAQFGRELCELAETHASESSTGSTVGTVSDRIAPDVRDALSRWARGEHEPGK